MKAVRPEINIERTAAILAKGRNYEQIKAYTEKGPAKGPFLIELKTS